MSETNGIGEGRFGREEMLESGGILLTSCSTAIVTSNERGGGGVGGDWDVEVEVVGWDWDAPPEPEQVGEGRAVEEEAQGEAEGWMKGGSGVEDEGGEGGKVKVEMGRVVGRGEEDTEGGTEEDGALGGKRDGMVRGRRRDKCWRAEGHQESTKQEQEKGQKKGLGGEEQEKEGRLIKENVLKTACNETVVRGKWSNVKERFKWGENATGRDGEDVFKEESKVLTIFPSCKPRLGLHLLYAKGMPKSNVNASLRRAKRTGNRHEKEERFEERQCRGATRMVKDKRCCREISGYALNACHVQRQMQGSLEHGLRHKRGKEREYEEKDWRNEQEEKGFGERATILSGACGAKRAKGMCKDEVGSLMKTVTLAPLSIIIGRNECEMEVGDEDEMIIIVLIIILMFHIHDSFGVLQSNVNSLTCIGSCAITGKVSSPPTPVTNQWFLSLFIGFINLLLLLNRGLARLRALVWSIPVDVAFCFGDCCEYGRRLTPEDRGREHGRRLQRCRIVDNVLNLTQKLIEAVNITIKGFTVSHGQVAEIVNNGLSLLNGIDTIIVVSKDKATIIKNALSPRGNVLANNLHGEVIVGTRSWEGTLAGAVVHGESFERLISADETHDESFPSTVIGVMVKGRT
ncbi:hypothetical protein BC829DRAFT_416289 [Chytridium lagenaria]|nr:hypothetical protein BC829DRAFT_416289 [Chytridium lagenaria]